MAFAFEKLLVYQKSVALRRRCVRRGGAFPRGQFFLADQLNRAALSIAANIAEGNGRFTAAERRNFLGAHAGVYRNVCRCSRLQCGGRSWRRTFTCV